MSHPLERYAYTLPSGPRETLLALIKRERHLLADNARLRGALSTIIETPIADAYSSDEDRSKWITWAKNRARQALIEIPEQ